MIEILATPGLSTVQDRGREGYLRVGVGTSGAMDRVALAAANILLGNDEGAAAIEIPLFPFRVRFLEDASFALTGADVAARLDGRPVPPWWTAAARTGQELELGLPASGARCYLALGGGIDVPVVLGSRSTQLRGSFGGHQGRMLQVGDVLRAIGTPTGSAAGTPSTAGFGALPPASVIPLDAPDAKATATRTCVRVLPAAEYACYDDASINAFWGSDWKVTAQSDRYGYRLAGLALRPKAPLEQRSHGIVPGVVQVPHGGQPIIQLRDAQPSGGYPKIGTVIEADLWRLGQARPGMQLRFVQATYSEAVAALREVGNYLDSLRSLVQSYRLSRT